MRLIDADALLDNRVLTCHYACTAPKSMIPFYCGFCELGKVFDLIEKAPTIERRGTWDKATFSDTGDVYYKCSECGRAVSRASRPNYCPDCGAKMDGGDAE